MSDESERLQILELINEGKISVEEGLKLLNAIGAVEYNGSETGETVEYNQAEGTIPSPLGGAEDFTIPPETPIPPVSPEPIQMPLPPVSAEPSSFSGQRAEFVDVDEPAVTPDAVIIPSVGSTGAEEDEEYIPPRETALPSEVERWKRWWMIPLYIGVGISVFGALLMFFAWNASQFSFWFACAWVPFLIGLGVMAFALASSRMRWLHLRVDQREGGHPRQINISMPLPIRLISWIIRIAGAYSPSIREKGVDQMILALENLKPDEPLHIEVDDEDGEHVEIFIG